MEVSVPHIQRLLYVRNQAEAWDAFGIEIGTFWVAYICISKFTIQTQAHEITFVTMCAITYVIPYAISYVIKYVVSYEISQVLPYAIASARPNAITDVITKAITYAMAYVTKH